MSLFQGADSCRLSHPVLSADGSCDMGVPRGLPLPGEGGTGYLAAAWSPRQALLAGPAPSLPPVLSAVTASPTTALWGPLSPCHRALAWGHMKVSLSKLEDKGPPAPHPSPRGEVTPWQHPSLLQWLLEAGTDYPTQRKVTGRMWEQEGGRREGMGGVPCSSRSDVHGAEAGLEEFFELCSHYQPSPPSGRYTSDQGRGATDLTYTLPSKGAATAPGHWGCPVACFPWAQPSACW